MTSSTQLDREEAAEARDFDAWAGDDAHDSWTRVAFGAGWIRGDNDDLAKAYEDWTEFNPGRSSIRRPRSLPSAHREKFHAFQAGWRSGRSASERLSTQERMALIDHRRNRLNTRRLLLWGALALVALGLLAVEWQIGRNLVTSIVLSQQARDEHGAAYDPTGYFWGGIGLFAAFVVTVVLFAKAAVHVHSTLANWRLGDGTS